MLYYRSLLICTNKEFMNYNSVSMSTSYVDDLILYELFVYRKTVANNTWLHRSLDIHGIQ